MAVLVHHVKQRQALIVPAHVVAPHAFVDEIVEVEVFHVLELGARCREQLLADAHVRVHGTAHVEEQQHLHRIVPLRDHLDVQQAGVAGSGANGVVEVEFVRRAGTGKFAQPPQGDLDIAGAQFHAVIQVPELALVPDFDRLAIAAIGPDPDTLGMVSLLPEGRGTAGADPFIAALMALLLLLQALLELLDQLFQAAEGFNPGPVFL